MDYPSMVSYIRNAIYTLKDFPRKEDELDDCGRFKRAIEATPTGGVLFIPSGKYVADSIEITKEMRVIGEGEVEIRSTSPNKDIFIVMGGRSKETFQILDAVARGDRGIELTKDPGKELKPGDMVIFTEEKGNHRENVPRSIEVHEIDAIEGCKIIFRDKIYLPKKPAEVNVYKVYPLENVHIENFRVRLREGSQDGRGLFANFVRNLVVKSFHGKRMAGSLIQIRKAMHVYIERFSNVHPQKVGSGQGYGVQFFGGVNFATIRDGYTKYCRHSVDLEGSYNVLIQNVIDIEGQGASFILVHSGWGTDITCSFCRAFNTRHTGFVVETQGYRTPGQNPYDNSYKYVLYNFQILNCEVQHKEGYATSHAGLFFTVPVKESVVSGCLFRHSKGEDPVPGTYGIKMWPCNNQLLVENCTVEGYNRGLSMWVRDKNYENTSMANKVIFENVSVRNCNTLALINNGELKCVHFRKIQGDGIRKYFFEIPEVGSFYEFTVEGINITNSPEAIMFTSHLKEYQDKPIKGQITNFQVDRPYELTLEANLLQGGKIPSDTFYLHRVGDSLFLSGEGKASAQKGEIIPNGIVQGQRITILAEPNTKPWIIHQGDNIRFAHGARFVRLDENRYAITFEWRKGKGQGFWYEI